MKCINILLIEDDELTSFSTKYLLEKEGHTVITAFTLSQAEEALEKSFFEIAFVDLDLNTPKEGFSILPKLNKLGTVSIILTGNDGEQEIQKGYDLGCSDYLLKPLTQKDILRSVKSLERPIVKKRFEKIIKSKFLTRDKYLMSELEKIKEETLFNSSPIFIHGKTGVGKTVLARICHESVYGNTKKFIEINCSNFDENLLESELFGHEKGSFTGANKTKVGLLSIADGGTIFLDEVGTMSLKVQQKLLKAIEEKSFYRRGGESKITSNFRIISATCDNIFDLISEKKFRKDLYFRLAGNNIEIPSLEKRKDDLLFLINHFKNKFGRAIIIKDDALQLMLNYSWNGNVRELKSFFEIRKEMPTPIIKVSDLPSKIINCESPFGKVDDSMLTRTQINFIKEKGLPAFTERMQLEAFRRFKKRAKSARGTMRVLEIGTGLYYKLEAIVNTIQIS